MEKALVIGAALSGSAVAKYLNNRGYEVYLTDSKILDNREELEAEGVHVYDGGHPDELLQQDYQLVIKNPGIKYTTPFVKKVRSKGYRILDEIEVGLTTHPEVSYGAITGTNGKTTTTTMLGELLKSLNEHNGAVGNIGEPVCDKLSKEDTTDMKLAIEIAAFQLLGCPHFHPYISVIMNLTPDHVDYFGSTDAYYKAKTLVYKNQDENDWFIRNVDDENVVKYCTDVKAKVIDFSLVREDVPLHISNNKAYYNDLELFDLDKFSLPGLHNVENGMIAGCMAYLMGVDINYIRSFMETFPGVEHRIEYVTTINGVKYYNDSKGTNVDSTIMALKAFNQPVHILVGGYDKKTGFDDLKPYLTNVKTMYAFGDTKYQFQPLHEDVRLYDDMQQALLAAYQNAREGEIVLLSPACASWDQFPNYEVRGKMFKDMVKELATR